MNLRGDEHAIPNLVQETYGDVEYLRQRIQEQYNFLVTPEYARDLIAFVEDMLKDDTREPRD
jgi:hypothetical protein